MIELYGALRLEWRADPIRYVKQRLGMSPTFQQRQIIEAVAVPGSKVSVRSGHGIGKTGALAGVIFWMLECNDKPRIPMTAPSASQLRDVLGSELAKWKSHSDQLSMARELPEELWLGNLFRLTQDKVYAVHAPNEIFAVARTARKESPDALQGFHASNVRISDDGYSIVEEGDGGELLFIVEEASGVHDKIFEVAEGALSSPKSRLIMAGNPTLSTGYFANSHKRDRASYTCLHFKSGDSPLVDKKYREELCRKFGEGSNVVRVRADGEFPLQDDDVLISLELTERSLHQAPYVGDESLPVILGVDPARFGSDRTAFVLRQGRNVLNIAITEKQSTMETAGRIMQYIREWKAKFVNIDVIGLGAGVVDRVKEIVVERELDVYIQAVGEADKSEDRSYFDGEEGQPLRTRDKLWLNTANWFRDEAPSLMLAPNDYAQDLVGELSSTKYKIDSSGRIVMESKDDMKKRGLRSPDIADALNLTHAVNISGIWSQL
jgi:phage terminase large subunit